MKTYPFSALFSRMKYITRWCLMRSTRPESLSEHAGAAGTARAPARPCGPRS